MTTKTEFKAELLTAFNKLFERKLSTKQLKQWLKHYSKENQKINGSVPLWAYSYNQGYYETALKDITGV